MKIIVTAGGTGGHIYPALSVINKFKETEKDLEIIYIGTHNRMEKDIIPKYNIKYESIEIYGFSKNIRQDIKNVWLIEKAYKKCLKIIQDFRPDVVIGFGGYVTFPVIKAAHKLNVPTFIHEQNSIPGKSNKALAKYATKIGVTFDTSEKYFKTNNVVFTGHPRSDEAIKVSKVSKQTLGFNPSEKLVVVVFGSLGSGSMNNKIIELAHMIKDEDYEMLYITGKYHFTSVNQKDLPNNVKVLPFYDNLIGLFKDTDVVISRAGSGVLNEIIALNLPSIIIPSPNVANNHQYYNAYDLYKKNACLMLEEDKLTAKDLKESINTLIYNNDKTKEIVNNLKKCEVQNSTTLIYNTIKDMINENNK